MNLITLLKAIWGKQNFFLSVLLLGCMGFVSFQLQAKEPVQVNVPTFKPVTPGSSFNDSDTTPVMGAVNQNDCQEEQNNWHQADSDYHKIVVPYLKYNIEEKKKYLNDLYFKDGGMPTRLSLPSSRIRTDLEYFNKKSRQTVPECTEINSCIEAKSIADAKLQACVWSLAATRSTGAKSSSKDVTPPIKLDCNPNEMEEVNEALLDIDNKIAQFLDSSLGQQSGLVTPMLRVVMWGTSKQAEIIEKHCAKSPNFKERVSQLNNAFDTAQKNCKQIQSDSTICVPESPEVLLANYEKSLKEERNIPIQASSSAIESSTKVDTCDSSASTGDFLTCETGRCRQSGAVPVKSTGGCLICGNEEGSLGEGFRWRSCHSSSKGVSAAR